MKDPFASCSYLLSAAAVSQFPPPDLPEITVSGRSNVGKSSLLNLITRRLNLAKVSKTPGKTRTINFFDVGGKWRLVDLPGYGYARLSKPEVVKWGKLIDIYLRERINLAGVIQLIDSRHDPSERDLEMMRWLAETGITTVVVLTKVDKLGMNAARNLPREFRQRWLGHLSWPVIATSAEKKTGRDELLQVVTQILDSFSVPDQSLSS
jgi:GTP-binding protein